VNVFSAAIGAGYWGLVLLGVVMSVAAAFFYLRVIVVMYMQEPEDVATSDTIEPAGPGVGAVLVVPAAATLLLGVFPGVIVGVIEKASVLRW
jgi:NADH-quinone oxidoreductase subunit N